MMARSMECYAKRRAEYCKEDRILQRKMRKLNRRTAWDRMT
jgi:hypothetical protein